VCRVGYKRDVEIQHEDYSLSSLHRGSVTTVWGRGANEPRGVIMQTDPRAPIPLDADDPANPYKILIGTVCVCVCGVGRVGEGCVCGGGGGMWMSAWLHVCGCVYVYVCLCVCECLCASACGVCMCVCVRV
jgi:hypothetical protein